MTTLPLYKYLDTRGAKLTLTNNTFRHAKPSDFNDVEDLTIQSLFPDEIGVALQKLEDSFVDVILAHLDDPPTCGLPMRENVALLQQVLRDRPELVEIMRADREDLSAYSVEYMRQRADAFIQEINDFMQGYRVLCVTEHLYSEKMWAEYAENHKGIALRIEPNLIKDSKFKLFYPVVYCEKRPSLFDDPQDFIAESLFGNLENRCRASLNKIIYSKTLKWQHEGEHRLAIAPREHEEPFDTLPYHPDEITELYLGLAMEHQDKTVIIERAQALNPAIAVFQARYATDHALAFDPV